MKKYGFGVDVGGTTIKMGLFEETGTLLGKWEIPTNKADNGAHILDEVASAIWQKLEEKQIAKQDVIGVGMDVPGPVSQEGVVNRCANIGWGVFDVKQTFAEQTGFVTKVANDANVAALGEMWQGGGKGYKNVVMLTLGTGVGGGIILNEQILAGNHGAGGEVGHLKVKLDETKSCGCGGKGCLEQYASATGIVRLTKEMLQQTSDPSSLRELDDITAKDVFDAAKEKDKIALEILEEVGDLLGMAIANITCTIDPEIIIIGGGVSKAGDILLDAVRMGFRKRAFHATADIPFALAKLGNDAGIYGGMKMLL